jgi:dTDP-4-amino-4,6-dideoxygalactose transaminase
VTLPVTAPGNEHVWHLHVVQVAERDRVVERLGTAGIGAGLRYPVATHLEAAWPSLGHRGGDFPTAEAAAGTIVSLSMFGAITPDQQARVADELTQAVA